MSRKKFRITKNIERVLLTEVLPYEVPLIFSNRHFYSFCLQNNIDTLKNNFEKIFNFLSLKGYSIPFAFAISREGQSPRTLSIIHPAKQIEIVGFYKEYKDIMLYYASQSPFSIRKPVRVGEYYYSSMEGEFSKEEGSLDIEDSLEIDREEGKHFKNFFSYYRYGNVYKFYESQQYQKCEKNFLNLYRFDINKCFDSIYTHSIAWAIYSKEFVKKNLRNDEKSFAKKIDRLMQSLNYNETHGILIGSEFARIFAEIILQKIDKSVFEACEGKYTLGIDYKVFRYVDDYFLFYNDEAVKEGIVESYASNLKEFKMSINQSKSHLYVRPIITELSIVKKKIQDYFFEQAFLRGMKGETINASKMITDVKIFIKDSGAEYKGIVNYLLALLLSFIQQGKKRELFQNSIHNIFEILDFIFFVFCVNVSVSSINRTTHLIKEILEISKSFKVGERSRIADKIFHEIERIVKKSLREQSLQIKEIYLLIILREQEIYKYRQIDENVIGDFIEKSQDISYFDIIVLLFYMQNENKYSKQKEFLKKRIKEKCKKIDKADIFRHTEASLLFFDLMTCPFIENEEMLEMYDICKADIEKYLKFSKKQKYWFVKWTDFNLLEEIHYRKSSETYS